MIAIEDQVRNGLASVGVSALLVDQLPALPADIEAVLVYGSQARGDAIKGSDLDLIALVPSPRASLSVGDVSLSFYTSSQLRTGIGTLFGAHLRRDAKIVWDSRDCLQSILNQMGDVDTKRLLKRARAMSSLFTTPDRDLPLYLPGLLRHARYLLRSSLYAQAIDQGRPCFSVREIARRHADPQLVTLLASRQAEAPSGDAYGDCLDRLVRIVGEFPQSRHGSLEATIVNEWGKPGDLLSAAFLALGSTGSGSMYAEVEKILL